MINFTSIWKGEKPPQYMLDLTNQFMKKSVFSLNTIIDYAGNKLPVRNVSELVNTKSFMVAVKTYGKYWENHEKDPGFNLSQEQMAKDIPNMIKIIPYWLVKGWIEPMQDPKEALQGKQGDLMTHWAMGNKPQQEVLNSLKEYLGMMKLTTGLGGNVKVITHGAGDVSEATDKPALLQRYLQGLGAKLAKDAFNLEMIQNEKDAQQLKLNCLGLIMFWTLKGWIEYPEL